MMDVNNDGIL